MAARREEGGESIGHPARVAASDNVHPAAASTHALDRDVLSVIYAFADTRTVLSAACAGGDGNELILSAERLCALADAMPGLEELECTQWLLDAGQEMRLPARLHTLRTALDYHASVDDALLERTMHAINHAAPLIRRLSLMLVWPHPQSVLPREHLGPELLALQQFARLEDLRLASTAHVAEALGALTQLKRLSVRNPMDQQFLLGMARGRPAGAVPQLQALLPFGTVNDQMMHELQQYPHLTEIFERRMIWTVPDPAPLLLPLAPGLRALTIALPEAGAVEVYCRVLAQLPALQRLLLRADKLRDTHLQQLLPALPDLQELCLHTGPLLGSLAFLRVPHLSRTLRRLQIDFAALSLPPSEIEHLECLTALEFLWIADTFSEPLEESVRWKMNPQEEEFRREVWPNLRSVYIARI